MVFYTCSGCGESLKKNKVEKHCYSCRDCEYLTCIDCNQDFYGNDYQYHTSCMTENERYSAKGTVFKRNKGDVKQEQWLQNIESVMSSGRNFSNKARDLIENLKNYDNIPRKRTKFLNFLKNSLRIYDSKLGEEVWEAFSSSNSKTAKNGTEISTVEKDPKSEMTNTKIDESSVADNQNSAEMLSNRISNGDKIVEKVSDKSIKKKVKKQKKCHENNDPVAETKKSMKRKRDKSSDTTDNPKVTPSGDIDDLPCKRSKNKNKTDEPEPADNENETPPKKKSKKKKHKKLRENIEKSTENITPSKKCKISKHDKAEKDEKNKSVSFDLPETKTTETKSDNSVKKTKKRKKLLSDSNPSVAETECCEIKKTKKRKKGRECLDIENVPKKIKK